MLKDRKLKPQRRADRLTRRASVRCCGSGVPRMVSLNVNGKVYQVDVDPRTPLLWVLRDAVGLTGTKYGCGIAQCGACTVHIDGTAMRACSVPVSSVGAKKVTTIEG